MKSKLFIFLLFFSSNIFGSGGYDHGTSAGKGNWDISLTWNPFNYFSQGQSYAILGYGLTDRFDFHFYYSKPKYGESNYYYGLFYQFLKSNRLDLATSVGIRSFINKPDKHIFAPQLLYTLSLNENYKIGGSIVEIFDYSNKHKGTANDIFISKKIFENKKIKIDFSIGIFFPVLWEPENNSWHPTYSFDFTF